VARRSTFAALLALAAALLVLGACGAGTDEAKRGGSVIGDSLTVYSSLPLRGSLAERMRATVNGEKLAIADAGGKVGDWTIKYSSLDDADGPDGWDPSATATNARKAAQDPTTIAFLGNAEFGATAISLPVLNAAGVAQVSPAATYTGFTVPSEKGEPDKYEPSGVPTFARVIPSDGVEGGAQAAYQRVEGCRRTFVLDDGGVEGRSLANAVAAALPERGIALAGRESADMEEAEGSDAVAQARAVRSDCVFLGASASEHPGPLLRALHRALPSARLFLPAALAHRSAELGAREQAFTRVTRPVLPPGRMNARARAVMRSYERRFGEPAPAEMLYGYEAMSLVIDTLRRAGERANERTHVAGLLRSARRPDTVLGPYVIRPSGDTTLRTFSGYRVRGGEPVFDRVLGLER
jgi:branched-chain amino acid transport system substrate-binding protein